MSILHRKQLIKKLGPVKCLGGYSILKLQHVCISRVDRPLSPSWLFKSPPNQPSVINFVRPFNPNNHETISQIVCIHLFVPLTEATNLLSIGLSPQTTYDCSHKRRRYIDRSNKIRALSN